MGGVNERRDDRSAASSSSQEEALDEASSLLGNDEDMLRLTGAGDVDIGRVC